MADPSMVQSQMFTSHRVGVHSSESIGPQNKLKWPAPGGLPTATAFFVTVVLFGKGTSQDGHSTDPFTNGILQCMNSMSLSCSVPSLKEKSKNLQVITP